MLGNVWEWTQDPWHENYQGAPADGSAWEDRDAGAYRVLCSGSWNDFARYVRAVYRFHAPRLPLRLPRLPLCPSSVVSQQDSRPERSGRNRGRPGSGAPGRQGPGDGARWYKHRAGTGPGTTRLTMLLERMDCDAMFPRRRAHATRYTFTRYRC